MSFFFEIKEPLLAKSQKLVLQHDVIKNMSCKPSKSLIKAISSVFYVTLPYKCLQMTKIRKVDIRKKLDIRNFSLLTKMFLVSRVDCTFVKKYVKAMCYVVQFDTSHFHRKNKLTLLNFEELKSAALSFFVVPKA